MTRVGSQRHRKKKYLHIPYEIFFECMGILCKLMIIVMNRILKKKNRVILVAEQLSAAP